MVVVLALYSITTVSVAEIILSIDLIASRHIDSTNLTSLILVLLSVSTLVSLTLEIFS